VAVHKGFFVIDAVPHVMTAAFIPDVNDVYVVPSEDVPNPLWLRPAAPSKAQQTFGRRLLEEHVFVLIPSAVSTESWNLLFNPSRVAGRYEPPIAGRYSAPEDSRHRIICRERRLRSQRGRKALAAP
jgi:RES domain-containing protein